MAGKDLQSSRLNAGEREVKSFSAKIIVCQMVRARIVCRNFGMEISSSTFRFTLNLPKSMFATLLEATPFCLCLNSDPKDLYP